MFMLLKDGFQLCSKCRGKGCYRCEKKGFILKCPVCGNSEASLFSKSDNDYECQQCAARFTKAGDVIIT